MIGLRLFLLSRRTGTLLIGLLAVVGAGLLLGPRTFMVGAATPVPVPWVAILPVLAAYLVAGTVVAPDPVGELLAARPVAAYSRAYLAAASLLAVGAVWWATSPTMPPVSGPAAVRGFLGLLGVSLLAIWAFGVAVGWLVPVTLLLGSVFLRPSPYSPLLLDWPVRDDGDAGAWVVALGLLAAGVSVSWTRRFLLRYATD